MYLVLRSNNDARIKAAVVFAERLFDGESFVVHEKDPTGELRVPLRPPKDVAADLTIKALAGGRTTPAYHVFELSFVLPKFSMYVPMEGGAHAAVQGCMLAVVVQAMSLLQKRRPAFNFASNILQSLARRADSPVPAIAHMAIYRSIDRRSIYISIELSIYLTI